MLWLPWCRCGVEVESPRSEKVLGLAGCVSQHWLPHRVRRLHGYLQARHAREKLQAVASSRQSGSVRAGRFSDFRRDFFLPAPSSNFEGCLRSELRYDIGFSMQQRVLAPLISKRTFLLEVTGCFLDDPFQGHSSPWRTEGTTGPPRRLERKGKRPTHESRRKDDHESAKPGHQEDRFSEEETGNNRNWTTPFARKCSVLNGLKNAVPERAELEIEQPRLEEIDLSSADDIQLEPERPGRRMTRRRSRKSV